MLFIMINHSLLKEMWAYTADNPIKVKYLYYILKNNIEHFREAASGMGSLPQISLRVTEEFVIPPSAFTGTK